MCVTEGLTTQGLDVASEFTAVRSQATSCCSQSSTDSGRTWRLRQTLSRSVNRSQGQWLALKVSDSLSRSVTHSNESSVQSIAHSFLSIAISYNLPQLTAVLCCRTGWGSTWRGSSSSSTRSNRKRRWLCLPMPQPERTRGNEREPFLHCRRNR